MIMIFQKIWPVTAFMTSYALKTNSQATEGEVEGHRSSITEIETKLRRKNRRRRSYIYRDSEKLEEEKKNVNMLINETTLWIINYVH